MNTDHPSKSERYGTINLHTENSVESFGDLSLYHIDASNTEEPIGVD